MWRTNVGTYPFMFLAFSHFVGLVRSNTNGLNTCICFFRFSFKQRNGNIPTEPIEITVYDYYVKHHCIEVNDSRNFPCLDVGKAKRPVYIPLEVNLFIFC